MTDPLLLSWGDLAVSSLLLFVFAGISVGMRLGLERLLAVAAVRSFVQLTILGLVLAPVFALSSPWPVALWCVVVGMLAGREALARSERQVAGMFPRAVFAMVMGAGGSALFAVGLVLQTDPWWDPRYLVPLVGMILGNALTGVSLGIDRVLGLLEDRRDAIEGLLAMGATRQEATREVARDAVRAGLVPILNTMSAVGLVSIPGMMTGQILGGTDPVQAARYQFVILVLIAAAVAIGTLLAVVGALRLVVDGEHRLRVERIFHS